MSCSECYVPISEYELCDIFPLNVLKSDVNCWKRMSGRATFYAGGVYTIILESQPKVDTAAKICEYPASKSCTLYSHNHTGFLLLNC